MIRVLAVLFALAVGMAGAAQAQERVVFAFGSQGFLFLPYYIAVGKGYFTREGITPENVVLKSGPLAMSAVLSGDADISGTGIVQNIQAHESGKRNIKAFAALVSEVATQVVITGAAAKKAGLTDASTFAERLKMFKGLRFAVTGAGASTDRFLRSLIQAGGFDAERDTTITPMGTAAAMLAAFSQNRIDSFVISSPTAEEAKVKFGGSTLVNLGTGEFAPLKGMLYNCFSARSDWLEKKGDTARRINRALASAMQLLRDNPDEARAVAKPFLGALDERVYDAAFRQNLASYPPSPRIEAAGVERNFEFIAATEGKRPNVRLEDLYTNAFN